MAIVVIAYILSFLDITPEECRHTVKLGVSIGVHGRRDPRAQLADKS
jgi:hypothetical protein